jgi:Secretion system C-terminal sorting domain
MKNSTLIILLVIFSSVAGYSQTGTGRPVQASVKMVRFFPNPATSFINFEFNRSTEDTYTFQVYNFLGKKVIDLPQVNSRTRVDLTNYTRGFYIFQLKNRNGKVIESGKFQVEK